ncbi:uncharacterized protein [Oscarella lobularis]
MAFLVTSDGDLTTLGFDFTKIRCWNGPDEECCIDATSKWMRPSPVRLVQHQEQWLLVERSKLAAFKLQVNNGFSAAEGIVEVLKKDKEECKPSRSLYRTCRDHFQEQDLSKRLPFLSSGVPFDYEKALLGGSVIIPRLNINLMGPDGVGKTCLRRHLLGLPFQHQPSTQGVEAQVAITSGRGWMEVNEEDKEQIVKRTIARQVMKVNLMDSSFEENLMFVTRFIINHLIEEEMIAQHLILEEEAEFGLEIGESRSNEVTATENPESILLPEIVAEDCMGPSSSNSEIDEKFRSLFDEKLGLTQDIADQIAAYSKDEVTAREEVEELVVNIRDQAGQGRFLMTHSSLTACRSPFQSTINILVFDVCKPLDEETVSLFRRDPKGKGERQEPHRVTSTPLRNFEHWIASQLIAKDERDDAAHLGKVLDERLSYPLFLFVATHGDAKGITPKLLARQNQLLRQLIRKCKIESHLLILGKIQPRQNFLKKMSSAFSSLFTSARFPEADASELGENRVYCLVDNTLSGTVSDDPTIKDIKEKGKQMAVMYWTSQPPIPLLWLTLMRVLASFRQRTGRPIMRLSEIYSLESRLADTHRKLFLPDDTIDAAIAYLNSCNAVLHFSDVPELRNIVFTDPQWLYDVMAIFVTPPDCVSLRNRHMHEPMRAVYETGVMVWSLASHILREKARIKEEDVPVMLNVLHLFDIICPDDEDIVRPGMDFFVPCLLTDYKEQLDSIVPVSPALSSPPSLLFRSTNVPVVPESLFLRLVSRCVKHFRYAHNSPILKRNRCLFFLEDRLKLELRYEQDGFLIAVTLTSVAKQASVQSKAYSKHCLRIRQFITTQLDEAKKRGMIGLRLKLYVQYSDKDAVDALKEDDMIPLTEYRPKLGQCLTTHSDRPIDDSDLFGLHHWYTTATVEVADETESGSIGGAMTNLKGFTWPNLEDDSMFLSVASCIAEAGRGKWRTVGIYLGMHREVKDTKFSVMSDDKERMLVLLHDWRDKEGPRAPASLIRKACDGADILHDVEHLLLKKQSDQQSA